MKPELVVAPLVGLGLLAGALITVNREVGAAQQRLELGLLAEKEPVAVADDAEEPYCTPEFKKVLQRVLNACGLASSGRRGCQPDDVQRLAELSDQDFNALFTPLKDRGGVILFDDGSEKPGKRSSSSSGPIARALVTSSWWRAPPRRAPRSSTRRCRTSGRTA